MGGAQVRLERCVHQAELLRHEGVQPLLPKILSGEKRKDRENGSQGIRQHMKIGGPELVILGIVAYGGMTDMVPMELLIPGSVGMLMGMMVIFTLLPERQLGF